MCPHRSWLGNPKYGLEYDDIHTVYIARTYERFISRSLEAIEGKGVVITRLPGAFKIAFHFSSAGRCSLRLRLENRSPPPPPGHCFSPFHPDCSFRNTRPAIFRTIIASQTGPSCDRLHRSPSTILDPH